MLVNAATDDMNFSKLKSILNHKFYICMDWHAVISTGKIIIPIRYGTNYIRFLKIKSNTYKFKIKKEWFFM